MRVALFNAAAWTFQRSYVKIIVQEQILDVSYAFSALRLGNTSHQPHPPTLSPQYSMAYLHTTAVRDAANQTSHAVSTDGTTSCPPAPELPSQGQRFCFAILTLILPSGGLPPLISPTTLPPSLQPSISCVAIVCRYSQLVSSSVTPSMSEISTLHFCPRPTQMVGFVKVRRSGSLLMPSNAIVHEEIWGAWLATKVVSQVMLRSLRGTRSLDSEAWEFAKAGR